jgi:integrase
LADTVAAMESECTLSRNAATAIRLLMLSGARKGEILSLRWEWISFDRKRLELPDSKTGAKSVPLAAAALAVLAGLPRNGSPYVLPGARGNGHYVGLEKDFKRVCERAELPKVRIHDMRHTFASFAVARGHSLFIIGKVLGHRQARTTERYAHLADDPIAAVASDTGNKIFDAIQKKSSL